MYKDDSYISHNKKQIRWYHGNFVLKKLSFFNWRVSYVIRKNSNIRKMNILEQKTKKQKGPKGFKITSEMYYLITKFKLDEKSLDLKKLAKGVALINAFIIAFVSTVLISLKMQIIIRLLIGFVLLFILIYACYEIYGNYLKKGRK